VTDTPSTPTPEEPDLLDSAVEAVPSLDSIPDADTVSAPDTIPDAPGPPAEDPELLNEAVEAVPGLPADQSIASLDPTPEQEIGHGLAAELAEMAVPEARPTAARDLIHEMIQAGAEGEITADLLRQELPPEEFTEADYAAYDAEVARDAR
jgi:hypothetical protein